MATHMVRIDEQSHRTLRRLAAAQGRKMQDIVAEALDRYQRGQFLKAANDDYARLRNDRNVWEGELDERRRWEGTIADGLDEK